MLSKYLYRCVLASVGVAMNVGCAEQQPDAPSPCAVALAAHLGASEADREVQRLQELVPRSHDPASVLERLGWAYVVKARESFDPGFYTLAGTTASCLDTVAPGDLRMDLLRGHVAHQLHRFQEAEAIARRLVLERGEHYDYALLGDVLMERGELDEAVAAYQKMMEQRPSPQGYARAAHVEWLRGNLDAARELIEVATSASLRDRESLAWMQVRRASYEMQAGRLDAASVILDGVLEELPDYAHALTLEGRLLMARGSFRAASQTLARAVDVDPLPENRWLLAEAMRAAGDDAGAVEIEKELVRHGEGEDPRTLSLFLATRGQAPSEAVRLAEDELANRSDVHTLDAVGWALYRASRIDEALPFMTRALSLGTRDARLYLHGAVITGAAGQRERSAELAARAAELEQMLLPSERAYLHRISQARVGGILR